MGEVMEFDPNGWHYTQAALDELCARFGIGSEVRASGGKAIGLVLAQKLCDGSRISVPTYTPGSQISQSGMGSPDYTCYIVRSSAADEDWLNPKAGEHDSQVVAQHEIDQTLDRFSMAGAGTVVHEYVGGVCCVVDVVYSQLLNRPVVRLATGRTTRLGVTSPTWDHGCPVVVYDADSFEQLCTSRTHFDSEHPAPEFLRSLVRQLREHKIEFGVQLELVVGLDGVTTHLVQIRPSPAPLRGMLDVPRDLGEQLGTTPKVSHVGSISRTAVLVDWLYDTRNLHTAANGTVVVWERLDKYSAIQQMHEALMFGAVAQIGLDQFMLNSTGHDGPAPLTSSWLSNLRPKQRELRDSGTLLVGFNYSDLSRLFNKLKRQTEPRIAIVSDGVVARIHGV